MKKQKLPEPAAARRPFFKCFPSDFVSGCLRLTPEEKAVYYTLIMLLYDTWEPIDDRTVKQRGDLARFCGVSPRNFWVIRDRLLGMPGKLFRTAAGLLSNARFERERAKLGSADSDLSPVYPPEKGRDNRDLNGEINGTLSNDPNGLRGSPYARESRVQSPDSTVQALSDEAEDTLESEIQQICRAIGVDLRQSTRRAGWPHQWVRMRTELSLTVGDMVAAIETYSDQFKGEQVRSLAMYKDRAIEKRVARELNDRLTHKASTRAIVLNTDVDDRVWFDRLKIFLRIGAWSETYGPSPLQAGCLAPGDLLDKAEVKWIEQGNHPELVQESNGRNRWRAHSSSPIKEPVAFAPRS